MAKLEGGWRGVERAAGGSWGGRTKEGGLKKNI